MRLNAKYKRRRTSRFPVTIFTWLVIGSAAGVVGWMWWENKPATNPPPQLLKVPRPATKTPPEMLVTPPPINVPPPPRPTTAPSPPSNAPPAVHLIQTSRPPPVIIDLTNTAREPVTNTASFTRVLQAQLALVKRGISPGSLDGILGSQTRAALRVFQNLENLPASGALNSATLSQLAFDEPFSVDYTVTTEDLNRLRPLGKTWLAKSEQDRLDYETILELVAEKAQSHPNLIRRMNPGVDWSSISAGSTLKTPRIESAPVRAKAAFLRINLAARTLQAFDGETNLLAHFPCSIGQKMEKRPVGELHVVASAPNPNYTFNPEVFPESTEARELGRKLLVQPGPNNPVGTVWIGLDRPGYGIHGTPRPEDVGRTESHGCFRLANWNVEYLQRLVAVGTPVLVEP